MLETTTGPECLVGQHIVTTGASGPEVFEVIASPLPGWYLCKQVNEASIKASVLFRLEELKNTNTLFFAAKEEALAALSSVGQKNIGQWLADRKPKTTNADS